MSASSATVSVQPGERQSRQRCVRASEATLGDSHNEVAREVAAYRAWSERWPDHPSGSSRASGGRNQGQLVSSHCWVRMNSRLLRKRGLQHTPSLSRLTALGLKKSHVKQLPSPMEIVPSKNASLCFQYMYSTHCHVTVLYSTRYSSTVPGTTVLALQTV